MNIAEELKKRRVLIALLLALVLVAGIGYWLLRPSGNGAVLPPNGQTLTTDESASSSAESTPTSPATSAASTASSSAAAAIAGCQPMTEEGFVPDRFIFTKPAANERVLSLGTTSDGKVSAPPKNLPRTASWWNAGPKPGSTKGKALLSIHTYRNGNALGNEMYAGGKSQFSPGDIIKLTGPGGKVACYEFVEAKKVWVKDYDENSDIMIDYDGAPLLTMIICWDFNRSDEDWKSRVFFYAKPVNPAS